MRPLIAIVFFIMGYSVGYNIATNPKFKTQPIVEIKNERR
jgi:hypothetical protein